MSTYLQIGMTIIAELCDDPKFAAALTSVNLWFLWGITIAFCACRDTAVGLDIEVLKALGGTIGFANFGAVILPPTKQMEGHIDLVALP